MDKLPDSLLLDILSRLDDSADVARCRVASKDLNTLFPGLRSINIRCTRKWEMSSSSEYIPRSKRIKPFITVFLDLISKMETVESICIRFDMGYGGSYYAKRHTGDNFVGKWLPGVSKSLKSLSISNGYDGRRYPSNVLSLISEHCHLLVNLKLEDSWLLMHNINPMPMLTSLTLDGILCWEDNYLNEFSRCFYNLQILNMLHVDSLQDPKIHLPNLKTCVWLEWSNQASLTLIAPNLTALTIRWPNPVCIYIEAPMLSYMHFNNDTHTDAIAIKHIENLKTLWLTSWYIGILLSKFPLTKTIETLTLEEEACLVRRKDLEDREDFIISLGKVFIAFPNVTSLCIKSGAWLRLEASLNLKGTKILDGREGLKTLCAYLTLVDRSLTFTYVSCVLDQCVGLSDVSLLIHSDVDYNASKDFMSKCMARWPGLKWRWGIWSDDREDSWITHGSSEKKCHNHLRSTTCDETSSNILIAMQLLTLLVFLFLFLFLFL